MAHKKTNKIERAETSNKNTLPGLSAPALMTSIALGSTALFTQGAFAAETNQVDCQKSATQQSITQECETKKSTKADEEIEHIKVHGVRHSIYHFDKSGDKRRVNDLIETPQVINVLTQDQISDSGRSDLSEILSAQSGVTLGTGENGNAFGDRYIIRGHEARSDVFVDGLRDPGMTTRESFATERVEITKGPSSTFAGRGSSGGAVNSVTKKASTSYDFGRVDASFGTDDYTRFTADYNKSVSDQTAVRVNALIADETKPGRDGIERERQGLQLSATHLATDKLSLTADYYFLNAEDRPDLGSYYDRDAQYPIEGIPVYAQDEDFQNSEVSTFTLRADYQIDEDTLFYNTTRFGKTENGYITTGVRGTTRDVSDPVAPGAYTLSMSTHQGWQDVEYFATQFNFIKSVNLAGLNHKFVAGVEYTDESVDNGVYDIEYANPTNCLVGGRRGVSGAYCILDGAGNQLDNIGSLMGRTYERGIADAQFSINTFSAYIMDTIKINDKTQIFLGLRQDSFDYTNDVVSRGNELAFDYSDDMYNGHAGILYDIAENGNVYLNYSTATNINGGESDLGANCGYGGLCGDPDQVKQSDPELVENIELGTKWQFFDEKLMATAALFQMTKDDVMESVGNDYSSLGTLNTGKNRVKGIELGLVGDINDTLSMQASATVMDSEVLESYNEENEGLALSNFAEKSWYIQLRYQPNETWAFGGDYSGQSEMYGGQPDTAAGYNAETGQYSIVVPSYQVLNLFANYNATEDLTLRVNVGNALDKEYWTAAYRSGSFMYLGDARTVRFTVNYQF